jgi:hypothetical protein
MTNSIHENSPPKSVFKYRNPDILRLHDIIIDNKLWAGKPSSFNDPFDCFPYLDLSGNYSEVKAFIKKSDLRTGTNRLPKDLSNFVRQVRQEGFGTPDANTTHSIWKQSVDKFGVVSFSEQPDNILLWSHYAQNHTGVCLEFGTEDAPTKDIHRVKYEKTRPIYRPLDANQNTPETMERVLLQKADFWRYEREWRYVSIIHGPGAIEFPQTALKSIILGAAVTPTFESILRALIATRSAPIPIKRARFHEREFSLHID